MKTTTDNEGRFKLSGLPAGSYQIRIEHSQFKPSLKASISVAEWRNTEVEFRLESLQACDDSTVGPSDVSDSDKAEIVRLALVDALVEKKIPDYRLLTESKKPLVISTQNIKPDWVPSLAGYTLRLMSVREIQRRADYQGDFLCHSLNSK